MTKLHLGAGTNVIKGWDNLDLEPNEGAIYCDLSKPLKYKDASISLIFSEHVIEHLNKDDARKLIEECYRVLKPGGAIRIGWPDLAKLIRAYLTRSRRYKDFVLPAIPNNQYGTWDEFFSDSLFSWEHRYAYTNKHLKMVLEDAGFKHVVNKPFQGSDYGITVDVRDDPATTYIEAVK